jgi:hypothetical protein
MSSRIRLPKRGQCFAYEYPIMLDGKDHSKRDECPAAHPMTGSGHVTVKLSKSTLRGKREFWVCVKCDRVYVLGDPMRWTDQAMLDRQDAIEFEFEVEPYLISEEP